MRSSRTFVDVNISDIWSSSSILSKIGLLLPNTFKNFCYPLNSVIIGFSFLSWRNPEIKSGEIPITFDTAFSALFLGDKYPFSFIIETHIKIKY